MVQLAQELENQVKHEDSLCREMQSFCDLEEDTRSWIRQLRENLESLDATLSIQERMDRIEVIERNIYCSYSVVYTITFIYSMCCVVRLSFGFLRTVEARHKLQKQLISYLVFLSLLSSTNI